MKKLLVILLICSIAFGAFAQVTIGGSVRAFGGFSTNAGGYYGMADGFGIKNDGSRLNINGNWDGKAGVSADLRFTPKGTDSAFANSFWAWAKPADWVKVNLGWFDFGDYVIKDATQTIKWGGNIRNTSKLDPLGGFVRFGAFGQFLLLDNNLNIGVGLFGSPSGEQTLFEDMGAYLAVMYNIPNIGKVVVDAFIPTSGNSTINSSYFTGTFQFAQKAFDIAVGLKFIGKGLNPNREFFDDGGAFGFAKDNFGVMVLANIRPIEKLAINIGADVFFTNGVALADSVSVSYDFGPIKPVFYTYGALTTDKYKTALKVPSSSTNDFNFSQVFGAEINIPVKFGKGSFLAAGIAWDTAAEAFQVPVLFRLFF